MPILTIRRLSTLLIGATLLVATEGCTVNPATGQRQLNLYGEAQEIALGREADRDVTAQLGLYPDEELQAYVAHLGGELARRSERPGLPWSFKVVDDPVVNAFALPGGFIYVTRGLLAHVGSEAELAGVLGHEIGHVTAQHGVNQMSKAQLATAGLGVGMVFSEEVRRYGGYAQLGMGLLFLKFGRDDERQADDLGLRYAHELGYPPQALVEVFDTLDRVSGGSEAGGVPSWLSTHPRPEQRAERIRLAGAGLPGGLGSGTWTRESYLDRLDGLVYGPDPRQGSFDGRTFRHPELAFAIEGPAGWEGTNQRQAVAWQAPEGEALLRLTLASQDTPAEAARAFLGQEGVAPTSDFDATPSGFTAVSTGFSAGSAEQPLRGAVTFVAYRGQVFQLLALARESTWSDHAAAFARSIQSFAELTEQRWLRVEPRRLEVVVVDRRQTLDQLAIRESADLELLVRLNGIGPDEPIAVGTRVKVVRSRG